MDVDVDGPNSRAHAPGIGHRELAALRAVHADAIRNRRSPGLIRQIERGIREAEQAVARRNRRHTPPTGDKYDHDMDNRTDTTR